MTRLTLKPRDSASSGGKVWGVPAERLAKLKELAREMRRNPTEAEERLWTRLSAAQLGGCKFQRKQVVGSAIVDFACSSRWLVVNVDGETANPELDAIRDRKLTSVGIRVLRFSATQIMDDPDGECDAILAELQKPFDRKAAARNAAQFHSDASQGREA